MASSDILAPSRVIHVDFTRTRIGAIQDTTTEGVVISLGKKKLPFDINKLRIAKPHMQEFFNGLGSVPLELHMSGSNFGKDTFLTYLKEGATVVSIVSLEEFLSVMVNSSKLKKISEESLEEKVRKMLDDAGMPMSFQYFSPKDLGNDQNIDKDFSLMENFWTPIYVPGEFFYSIKTSGDDVKDPRVSPEAISLESVKDPDLTLLIAHYIEQLYYDGIENYGEDSCVELIRYDYRNRITNIFLFSFAEIIGCTLTEMKDRIPLLSGLSDPLEITKKYIERKIAPEENAIITDIRNSSKGF